jgi:copper oxidase (laccase) domain-containing protein
MSTPVEIYPSLAAGGACLNAFVGRIAALEVETDRDTAMQRLASYHEQARYDLGFEGMAFVTAEQVHGNGVAIVGESTQPPVEGVDALVTNRPNVCLGIYVADCCAVYAVDAVNGAIGLAHSGKKGTELGIVPAMLRKMECAYGTDPAYTVIQLSPCIRPPHYEIDFAAEIVEQCHEMGVGEVIDPGTCTASDLERFYSYRMEKGRTGRMLALLALMGPRVI